MRHGTVHVPRVPKTDADHTTGPGVIGAARWLDEPERGRLRRCPRPDPQRNDPAIIVVVGSAHGIGADLTCSGVDRQLDRARRRAAASTARAHTGRLACRYVSA